MEISKTITNEKYFFLSPKWKHYEEEDEDGNMFFHNKNICFQI